MECYAAWPTNDDSIPRENSANRSPIKKGSRRLYHSLQASLVQHVGCTHTKNQIRGKEADNRDRGADAECRVDVDVEGGWPPVRSSCISRPVLQPPCAGNHTTLQK